MKNGFFFCAVLMMILSCSGGTTRGGSDENVRVLGFIGNDVLRVEARAADGNSCDSAVDLAKQKLLEIYSGRSVSSSSLYQPVSTRRFMRIVERGRVISTSRDPEGRCVVVYEISSMDLRQMLGGAVSTP